MGRSIHFSNSTLRRVCFCSLSLTGANLHQCHVSPISHAQWSAKGERNESGKCDGKASCCESEKYKRRKIESRMGMNFSPPWMEEKKSRSRMCEKIGERKSGWKQHFLSSYFRIFHTHFSLHVARALILFFSTLSMLFFLVPGATSPTNRVQSHSPTMIFPQGWIPESCVRKKEEAK